MPNRIISPTSEIDRSRSAPVIDRVMRNTDVVASGCWLWRGGCTTNGAGIIKGDGPRNVSPVLVHRVSYEANIGPIPERARVYQVCGNKTCVNPEHLRLQLRSPKKKPAFTRPRFPDRECVDCQRTLPYRAFTCSPSRPGGRMPWCRECGRSRRAKTIAQSRETKRRAVQGSRCWYCGVRLNSGNRTIDHVVPKSKGGTDDLANLVPCCHPCNMSKRNWTLEEWREYKANQRDGVPYFNKAQRAFFSKHNVQLPKGEPFVFWFEKQGKADHA